MLGQTTIDEMDERMTLIEASLTTTLTTRVVKRSYLRNYDSHESGEIEKGVLMIISAGERGYNKSPGMTGREGIHRILLAFHIKVDDTDLPVETEKAELAFIKEIKAWIRSQPIDGIGLEPVSIIHSKQLEFPYGSGLVEIDAGPPLGNNF